MLSPLAGTSCAQVLDIEEAELDQTFGAGGSGAGGATAQSPCERYCDTVMTNCVETKDAEGVVTSSNKQYDSMASCLAVCARFPSGIEGDRNDFTLACRQTYAELAATSETELHCAIAGPTGNGTCGDSCLSFCTIMIPACPGAYLNPVECAADCRSLRDLEGYNTTMSSGDTVQCRIYHASVATVAPDVHCRHAKGAAPCVD
jgi:hypothetical protein